MTNLMTSEEKENIIDEWIMNLRSDKYEQGVGALNTNNKYCCLGVLCEILHSRNFISKKIMTEYNVYYASDFDKTYLNIPYSIAKIIGISPHGDYINNYDVKESLVDHNDNDGMTFAEIASIIEIYKSQFFSSN